CSPRLSPRWSVLKSPCPTSTWCTHTSSRKGTASVLSAPHLSMSQGVTALIWHCARFVLSPLLGLLTPSGRRRPRGVAASRVPGAALPPAAAWPSPGTHSPTGCGSAPCCRRLAGRRGGVRGAAGQTASAGAPPDNASCRGGAPTCARLLVSVRYF